jgi:hypothetical protein
MDSLDYMITIKSKQVSYLVENNIRPNVIIIPIKVYKILEAKVSRFILIQAHEAENKKLSLLGMEVILSSDIDKIKVGYFK